MNTENGDHEYTYEAAWSICEKDLVGSVARRGSKAWYKANGLQGVEG